MLPAIQTKTELFTLLKNNAEHIRQFGVNRIGVFGSFRHDTAKSNSDIDFLVDFEPSKKTYQNIFDLYEFLGEQTGRKVEVLTKQGLSKYIGPYILKDVEYVSL